MLPTCFLLQSDLRQALPMPQLWGELGCLGPCCCPPLRRQSRAGQRGAVCVALHKQHPGVQCCGHPVPGGVTQVRCHLAFGNRCFSQVQRGSAEDSSLFPFNVKEVIHVSALFGFPLAVVCTASSLSLSQTILINSVLHFYYKILDKIMVFMMDLSIEKGRERYDPSSV